MLSLDKCSLNYSYYIIEILHFGDEDKLWQHTALSENYNPTREDWTSYAECLELYFTANELVTEKKQQAILLSICGAETDLAEMDLMVPTKPTEKNFC